jgi:hypothetical protein
VARSKNSSGDPLASSAPALASPWLRYAITSRLRVDSVSSSNFFCVSAIFVTISACRARDASSALRASTYPRFAASRAALSPSGAPASSSGTAEAGFTKNADSSAESATTNHHRRLRLSVTIWYDCSFRRAADRVS